MMMRIGNWMRNASGKITMNFSRLHQRQSSLQRLLILLCFLASHSFVFTHGCQFYPVGEYLRFVRIPENLRIGDRVMNIEVRQRHNLTLQSIDKGEDAKFFTFTEINEDMVEIRLAKSLEHIVDNDSPQNILKFRVVCYPAEEHETTPSFLSVTIYVEDINNRSPSFVHAPYFVTVDELTPVGLIVFRGINAVDMDKPNTANSDIHFSIIDGNEEGKFGLESSHHPALKITKSLDYDAGDHEFNLVIMASDRGNPPLSSTTTLHVKVQDNDDLDPIFTKNVYRTQIKESYPLSNDTIRQEITFPSPVLAYDQDTAINTTVQYDLVSGNEMNYFEIDSETGTLYLIKDVDREALSANTFELQIRARQINDPSKYGLAKLELGVIDINDNLPIFEVDVYNISIMENLPNGFSVVQVYARDMDQGENAEFTYKLEERASPFAIDPKSGWLTVRDQSQLDREKLDSIKLKVVADEKVPNVASSRKGSTRLEIFLLDSNDNSPRWIPSNLYKFQVTLDSEIGSVVGKITAEDPDLGGNGKVMYDLQKSNGSIDDLPFEIDAKTGYIFLLERPLPKLQYTLLVEAADQPSNPSERRYSLAVVQIDVVKAGAGHAPEFIGSPYEFWVGTQVGIGTSVGQVKVKDLDPKYTVYDLLHSYFEGVPFAIEERTGIIAVVDELIKYPRHQYDFEAYVTDSRHTLTTNVSIHIVDPIDGAADGSTTEPIELYVNENVGGAIVANLRKEFGLTGQNSARDTSAMEFLLANFDARDKFAISTDGTIYTLKGLDREEKARHLLTVISQSRGVIQGQGVYQIFVNVKDTNDNAPTFDQKNYEGHVRENSNPGTPVQMDIPVRVIDLDEGANAKFKIELVGIGADRFRVDPQSGKLYVGNIPLDREEKQLYTLELIATDSGNMSSKVPLKIYIDDVNDNSPVFFQNIVLDPPELDQTTGPRELLRSSASQPVSVEISNTEPIVIPETISVGSRVARVMASDRDLGDNSKIFYRIVSESNNPIGEKFNFLTDKQYLFSRNKAKHFVIDRLTGEISVAKPLKPDTEYGLNITASDRGGLRTYTGIKVVVTDVNNHLPVFDKPWYTFEIIEGIYKRQEIGKISAKDGDSGLNGEIFYSLEEKEGSRTGKLPFIIDFKTGQLFADGDLDREKYSQYSFQVVASDKGTLPMESKIDVDVHLMDSNDNKPEFYNFMSTAKFPDLGVIPIYRTTSKDNIPLGNIIAQVYANDSDSPSNGNGLVLFHLSNNYKEFHIDSKNGSIFTMTKLDYDVQSDYNLTVVASDLGKPSLSSTAWMLIRILDSRGPGNQTKERKFDREVYTFQVKRGAVFPQNLIKFNVTEKYKRLPTEFDLLGDEDVISLFRIEPTTGKLFLTKALDDGKKYEFLVRSQNKKQVKGFDTRQASKISERFLEYNEALVRVTMEPAVLKPVLVPIIKKRNHTNIRIEQISSTASTNSGPRIIHGFTSPPPPTKQPHNHTDLERTSPRKDGSLFIGEIAVLALSAVIFIGGLIAAISVACIRRKRRTRRRLPYMSPIPVEVHLKKQMGMRRNMGNPSARPVLFPMALPGDPVMSEGTTSENTSDTYTDSPPMHRETHTHSNRLSYNLKANGYSICQDCRKLKKPGRFINPKIGTDPGDQGPLKQFRAVGIREISLPSSNDSGIDGSDGQCTCCHSHNSSSDSGRSAFLEREQYEDSLMPPMAQSKSFRRKRTTQNKQFVGNVSHVSSGKHHPHGFSRRHDGIIVL